MSRKTSKAKAPYKLGTAPVEELVLACYFPHVADFRAEHVGLFWTKHKAEFPKSQQAGPIIDFGDIQTGLELFPMPRFWFISADDTRLMQIQRNAFLLNWRRKPDQDYPHFDAMFESFNKLFELFRAFLTNECGILIDTTTRLEINYINIIPPNKLWKSPQEISRVFPSVSIPEIAAYKEGPTAVNLNYRYQLSLDDVLSINIANGKQAQTNQDVLLLDVKIQGTPADKRLDGMDAWFKTAHQYTRKAFLSFTNPKMRAEVWKESGDA